MRAIDAIVTGTWAIRPESLDLICSIARRDNDVRAVEQTLGRPLEHARQTSTTTLNTGQTVATIPVDGPIFRHANMFTEISGATSISSLALDLRVAADDPKVDAIILNIDSPGGEVTGVQEFADQIAETAKIKPVVAYVDGNAASAAYWLASAASAIVMPRTGAVGSIGVVCTVEKPRDDDDFIEIVSTHAPTKRVDPTTDEGHAEILTHIDDLEEVFIADVANHRGVSVATVISDFGGGSMLVGKKALDAGMVDMIGNYSHALTHAATLSRPLNRLQSQQAAVANEPEQTQGDDSMGIFSKLFKTNRPEGETDEQSEARAERLAAAFPGQDEFVVEQYKVGSDVPAAVAAMVEAHEAALLAKDEELAETNQECDALTSKVRVANEATEAADAAKVEADQKLAAYEDALKDKEHRPPVVIGGEGDETVEIVAKHTALVAGGMKPTLAWKQLIAQFPAEYEAYARPAPVA